MPHDESLPVIRFGRTAPSYRRVVRGLSRLAALLLAGLLLVGLGAGCATPRGALQELAHLYGPPWAAAMEGRETAENPSRLVLGDLALLRRGGLDGGQGLSSSERLEAVVVLARAAHDDPVPVVRADALRTLGRFVLPWRALWESSEGDSPEGPADGDGASASPAESGRATAWLRAVVETGRLLAGEGDGDGTSAAPEGDASRPYATAARAVLRRRDIAALLGLGRVRMPGEGGLEPTVRLIAVLSDEAERRPDPGWRSIARGAARGLACHALHLAARSALRDPSLEVRAAAAEAVLDLDPEGSVEVVFAVLFPAVDLSPNPIREDEVRIGLLEHLARTTLSASGLPVPVRSRLAELLTDPDPALSRAAARAARSILGVGEEVGREELPDRLRPEAGQ